MNVSMPFNPSSLRRALCCLLLVLTQTAAAVESLTGRPARIISGNELVLLSGDGVMHRVKLNGIDTQSPNQPWGAAARKHLQALVMGRSVTLFYQRADRTKEIRGQLRHGGADINIRLLDAGLARLNRYGLSHAEVAKYAAAEQRARATGQGIWGVSRNRQPPASRTQPGNPLRRIQR
ncbi:MAG: thermonuclease family protein [Gammaproteobacteria bacterium]|nr:thermonuclease family protein [Gammaproteobacteria bacterium]